MSLILLAIGLDPQNGARRFIVQRHFIWFAIQNLLFYFTEDKNCERKCLALEQFKGGLEPPLGHNIEWKEGDCTHWIRD